MARLVVARACCCRSSRVIGSSVRSLWLNTVQYSKQCSIENASPDPFWPGSRAYTRSIDPEKGAATCPYDLSNALQSKPTLEGAGVNLRRAFGFGDTSEYDPFLLFDDFRNDNPDEYLAGFPWHPHRGIETITYVLAGTVEHGDSLGNRGSLGAGDVQWMTAGSGILHQEMPQGDPHGRMHGFQLWANLPSSLKMTAPRYQDVAGKDVPEVVDDDGTRCGLCAASFWGKTRTRRRRRGGSALSRCVDPAGCAQAPAGRDWTATRSPTSSRALERFETRRIRARSDRHHRSAAARPHPTASETDRSCCSTAATKSSSRPATKGSDSCSSPASRSKSRSRGTGPIVMNTRAELQLAFDELNRGTFIKQSAK